MIFAEVGVLFRAIGLALYSILKDLGLPTRYGPLDLNHMLKQSNESVDDRIAKLDQARESLSSAIQAINELEEQANSQKRELVNLTIAAHEAELKNTNLQSRMDELRRLSAIDANVVQEAFNIPSRLQRWMERLIGFLLGIAASIIASLIYSHFFV